VSKTVGFGGRGLSCFFPIRMFDSLRGIYEEVDALIENLIPLDYVGSMLPFTLLLVIGRTDGFTPLPLERLYSPESKLFSGETT
jgi:hypothetical protein